jgi:hypothetical protein
MTYDHKLILITPSQIIGDDIGNQIPSDPIETPILCGLKSVGRSEFYNAAVAGLRPELVFVVHAYEYEGQKSIKFEGIEYRVIRTYSVSFEEMELTCERVAADG